MAAPRVPRSKVPLAAAAEQFEPLGWPAADIVGSIGMGTPPSPAAATRASLSIQEQFVSIQGEGVLVGTPSSFVRVAGCNLRCSWCDSPQTSWTPNGTPTPIDEIVEFCAAGPRHVVLTGGEPLLFEAIAPLSQRLTARGHHITIETAATVLLDEFAADLVSMSPKLAHSSPHGRDGSWGRRHEQRRLRIDVIAALMAWPWQLKFVVRANDPGHLREDVTEIEAILTQLPVTDRSREQVLLMPECTDPTRLHSDYAALVPICRERGFRVGERLHIAIFGHRPGT